MLIDLVKHVEITTGLPQTKARAALGIILNAAERQGSPMAEEMFKTLPGARTLSAKIGSEIGASTGEIARLIEKTPGGRRYVNTQMIRSLHNIGLGHDIVAQILPAISKFMNDTFNMQGFGHLGDLFGTGTEAQDEDAGTIAA